MQLEEAMEKVLTLTNIYEHEHDKNIPNEIICMNINERDSKALQTVLQALENSVPKEVIEEKIHKVELPNVIVGGKIVCVNIAKKKKG